MGYCAARIHIIVKSPEAWKKLYAVDWTGFGFSTTGENLLPSDGLTFTIDGSWDCYNFSNLLRLVEMLAAAGKNECVVVSDAMDMSSDESTFVAYYFGVNVRSGLAEGEEGEPVYLQDDTDITDIATWLTVGDSYASAEERKYLESFDIHI